MNSQLPVWISFTILFIYLTLNMLMAAALQGMRQYSRWTWVIGLFFGGWLSLVIALGAQDSFRAGPTDLVPRIAYGFIPLFLGIGLLSISPLFTKMIMAIPPQWIIGIQVNRLLGSLFLLEYAHGQLPPLFAIPAGVGDILVSIFAAFVAYLFIVKHPKARALGVAWNILGITDLLVAIITGVITSPGRLQLFAFNAPNQLMTTFPFVIIPAFGVPVWLLLHVFSLRRLMVKE